MRKERDILDNNEKKLHYIIKYLKLKTNDLSSKLSLSPSMVSQIQNQYTNKLKPYHLYAISHAYNIPMNIFENEHINTAEMIKSILDNSIKRKSPFYQNEALLEKMLGEWYLYSYPSNSNHAAVYATKHLIYADGSIEDQHNNRGKIYFGQQQSLIVKESNNSKNLTSITFDNNRVTYEYFAFSRVSKSINLNKELFNFGFFSREKLSDDDAISILGDRSQVQLQINYEMLERLTLKIKI